MPEQDPRLLPRQLGTASQLSTFPCMAVVLATVLASMGRVWWCEAGDWWPWSWNVWSRHNSQHLVDPYTLSHIEHGLGLYVLLLLLPARTWSIYARVWIVAIVELTWEVVENTNWMIQRYRETTISLDYFGDSILNSVSDFGACLGGIAIATRLSPRLSCGLFAILELASVVWIRDSLLLNILMLVSPIEVIRQWQMAGAPS